MWLTIVLERHLLPGSNLKIKFNAPSPGFAFQQPECTTSRREFIWKNFYSARIKFSPRMLSRFCLPAGFSPGSWRRVFFSAGSRRVQISWRDFCRDTQREFFPGRSPPGKWATSVESRRDPGEPRESWQDPGEIPVPILQGFKLYSCSCYGKLILRKFYSTSSKMQLMEHEMQISETVGYCIYNSVN